MNLLQVRTNDNCCTNCGSDDFVIQEWDIRTIDISTLQVQDDIRDNGVDDVMCRKCSEVVDVLQEEIKWDTNENQK